jgi:hypothetical protein
MSQEDQSLLEQVMDTASVSSSKEPRKKKRRKSGDDGRLTGDSAGLYMCTRCEVGTVLFKKGHYSSFGGSEHSLLNRLFAKALPNCTSATRLYSIVSNGETTGLAGRY